MRSNDSDLLTTDAETNIFSGAPSFSLGNRLARALWIMAWALLVSWTPPPLHRWRILVLRAFGAKIGTGCRIYRSVRVWYPPLLTVGNQVVIGPRVTLYNQGRITIRDRTVISQGAHLCSGTHGIRDPSFQLVVRPITIGAGAWVAAEAFIGPGVNCGDGSVLAARGAAFRDLEPGMVYRGNPAEPFKSR